MISIPLADLKLYSDWRDAPLGALLSYASTIFVTPPGSRESSYQYEGAKFAIRAKSSVHERDFLVVLKPEPMLAAQTDESVHGIAFGAVEAVHGPAVDVGEQFDLEIEPAPISSHLNQNPEILTVIRTQGDGPILMVFAGDIGRSARYLILEGEHRGKLVDAPRVVVDQIGKLVLVQKSRT